MQQRAKRSAHEAKEKETHQRSQSSGTADHVVVNYRTIAPVQRLRRSRVLHSSAGETALAGHVAVNFPKMALGGTEAKETEPQPEEQVVKMKR